MGAMRKVVLQFGLVQAQVAIVKATNDPETGGFRQTHNCDNKGALYPVSQKLVCTGCQKEVPRADITKAFEPTKGTFMAITEAELEGIRVPTSNAIVIEQFVKPSAVLEDPTWLEGSVYRLEPPAKEKYPAMGYAAIAAALKDDYAIGRTTAYGKEYTVLLRMGKHAIMMHYLRYPSEIRPEPSLDLPQMDPSYLTLIGQVKETMRVDKPNYDYTDSYGVAKAKLLEAKVAGQPLPTIAPAPEPVQTLDLKKQLEAMMAAMSAKAAPEQTQQEQPKAKTGKGKKKAVA